VPRRTRYAIAMWRCLIPLISCQVLVLAARAAGPDVGQTKLEPRLRASVATTNDALVLLAEQADLRSATSLKSKAARGAYVLARLTETAQRSQTPLTAWLAERGLPHQSFWLVNMIQVRADGATLAAIAERADTLRVVANTPLRAPEPIVSGNAPAAASVLAWGVEKVRAPEVWALGFTGAGIVVGGQDTGYQWNHPALLRQYRGWNGAQADHNYNWHDAIHGHDLNNAGANPCGYNTPLPCDDGAHGTHTMGTMVGDDGLSNQIGVAPGARWIGCRNMERGWGTPATYTECFQWFVAPTDLAGNHPDPTMAPDVINNSWGCPPEEGCADPLVLQLAIEHVRAAGIVVVFAAGNSGSGCSTVTDPGATYRASFTVGATDSNDTIAGFSSRGPVTADGSQRLKPDVAAPGVNVRSCVPGNGYASGWSGTSMAAPHVAGVVALLLSAHPELRGEVAAVERILEQTAVPRSAPQSCGGFAGAAIPNPAYGWGRVDAHAALALEDGDGDGLPDWWEIWHELDRTDPSDAGLDPDADGATNLAEYLAGTDPRDAASVFRIASVQIGEGFTLRFESSPYRRYTLESRSEGAAWTPVPGQEAVGGHGGTLAMTQTNLPPEGARFYRVRVGR